MAETTSRGLMAARPSRNESFFSTSCVPTLVKVFTIAGIDVRLALFVNRVLMSLQDLQTLLAYSTSTSASSRFRALFRNHGLNLDAFVTRIAVGVHGSWFINEEGLKHLCQIIETNRVDPLRGWIAENGPQLALGEMNATEASSVPEAGQANDAPTVSKPIGAAEWPVRTKLAQARNETPDVAAVSSSMHVVTEATDATTVRAATRDLRALASQLVGEINTVRAIATAFRLAANADEGGGQSALYWPDLIAVIESKLPEEERIDRAIGAIAENLDGALHSVLTVPSSGRVLTQTPRARTGRAALVEPAA